MILQPADDLRLPTWLMLGLVSLSVALLLAAQLTNALAVSLYASVGPLLVATSLLLGTWALLERSIDRLRTSADRQSLGLDVLLSCTVTALVSWWVPGRAIIEKDESLMLSTSLGLRWHSMPKP